jgi:hypothetical protein
MNTTLQMKCGLPDRAWGGGLRPFLKLVVLMQGLASRISGDS